MKPYRRGLCVFLASLFLCAFFLAGCGRKGLRVGYYANAEQNSYLVVKDDNTVFFLRHIAMNFAPNGSFTLQNGILSIVGYEEYTFRMEGDTLTFTGTDTVVPVGTVYTYIGKEFPE